MEALRLHFRPEFLNRVDDIVLFHGLGRPEIERIIELQLAHLRQLLVDRRITLTLSPEARELVVAQGYDPQYGARPLKRSLQRLVQNPLAAAILRGEVLPEQHVRAELAGDGGHLRFVATTPAAAVA